MKLDKIKFAQLVGFIQRQFAITFNTNELCELDNIIDVNVPEYAVTNHHPSAQDVNYLLHLMHQGNQKIDAIKMHRKLTGWGLKESKDEVEKYWKNDTAWTKAEMKGKINLLAHSDDADTIISFIESL